MKGLRLTSSFANLEDNNYDKILFTLKKTQHYIEKLNDIFSEHLLGRTIASGRFC